MITQQSHPPPKKPLPMNPLASPVTEWGAPGAYTRSKILLRPTQRPQLGRRGRAYYPLGKSFLLKDHRVRSWLCSEAATKGYERQEEGQQGYHVGPDITLGMPDAKKQSTISTGTRKAKKELPHSYDSCCRQLLLVLRWPFNHRKYKSNYNRMASYDYRSHYKIFFWKSVILVKSK